MFFNFNAKSQRNKIAKQTKRIAFLGSAAAPDAIRCASRRTLAAWQSTNVGSVSSAYVSREARLTAPEAGALPFASLRLRVKTVLCGFGLALAVTGCMTHETMGNAAEKLDMSTFYLPNDEASRIVEVTSKTNGAIGATVYVQTHAVSVKENASKEALGKFGEVYAFSPSFFVVHKDERTMVHFFNLQPDDNHDFMLFAPDQVFLKMLLPPLRDTAYVFTFHREGLFNFTCAMHQPSMSGQILVLPPRTK
jgi:plastocyanin